MKRGMVGGAHRGPIAPGRQRRTIRMMQGLLVVVAAGLLLFAGYSWGRAAGFEEGRRADDLGGPRPPSSAQIVVPGLLGLGCLAAAFLLQAEGGVRLLTPARLEEMQGRSGRPDGSGAHEPAGDPDPHPPAGDPDPHPPAKGPR